MEKDNLYREHILEAIGKIRRYIARMDFAAFEKNEMAQDAVVRELEIIGEAARHLSEKFKGKYPTVPWSHVAGMRNKLIHEYFGIDLEIVWKTITEDLRSLEEKFASGKTEK